MYRYGHGKFEAIGAMSISAALLATAGGIAYNAYENVLTLFSGESLGTATNLALFGAIISIGVKEVLFRQTMHVANKYDSQVVRANAWLVVYFSLYVLLLECLVGVLTVCRSTSYYLIPMLYDLCINTKQASS